MRVRLCNENVSNGSSRRARRRLDDTSWGSVSTRRRQSHNNERSYDHPLEMTNENTEQRIMQEGDNSWCHRVTSPGANIVLLRILQIRFFLNKIGNAATGRILVESL